MENWIYLGIGAVFAAMGLIIGHYWPLLETPSNIKRYIYGTVVLYLGLAIWLLPQGYWWILAGFAGIIGLAGLANIACYFWDDHIDHKKKVIKIEAVDDDLKKLP